MMLRPVELPRAVDALRRYGVIAGLVVIAAAGFATLTALGLADRQHGAARMAEATVTASTDKAMALLDRQQRSLDQMARIGTAASDAAAQQLLDQVPLLAPGVRGAVLADPSGAIELRGAGNLDPTTLAALAVDAANQAASQPDAALLATGTLHDGETDIVGLARPWRDGSGRLGGIAIIAIDPTAFDRLDLVRGDGSPLFAAAGAPGAQRRQLGQSPLWLRYDPREHPTVGWPSVAAAGIGLAALLGLLVLLLGRLNRAEQASERHARIECELHDRLAVTSAAASRTDEVNRAKSRFFAQVTHELRTPLNAILGFSETIRQELFGPVTNARYLEYAGLIHDAGAHLLSLINDLLDEARIEAGKMEIAPIRMSTPALVRSALDLVELLAAGREIAIATSGLSLCPDLNVDPRAMKQVLVNLLSNAIKYTPPGGHIDLRCAAQPDGGATIEITDTGIGMSAEDLRLAFEPFGRANDLATRRQQGTGLGLSLARALVRLHGGDVTLDSRLDAGTTVTVILPASAVFPSDIRTAAPAKAA
jgi:signal transduction histidine kinase